MIRLPNGIVALMLFLGQVGSGGEPTQHASDSSSHVRFAFATSVSEGFQQQTRAATESIPQAVWETVHRAGWTVQLAEFVVDAEPSLRNSRPRGWPTHLTWENSDAVHLPSSKVLVLAEKRRNRNGEVVPSTRIAGVFRHELGHAFDMAAGSGTSFVSSTTDFVNAYNRDVSQLSDAQRERFAYYLQRSRAGWQETFAEAFAVALGGGSSEVEPPEFEAAFPGVVRFTRKVIEEPPQAPTPRVIPATAVVPVRRGLFRRR